MKRTYGVTFCTLVLALGGCAADPEAVTPTDDAADVALADAADTTAATAATAADVPGDEERLEVQSAEVVLGWRDLERPGSIVPTRGTTLALTVSNTTRQPLGVRLQLTGDDGGATDRKIALGAIRLAPGEAHPVIVDVADLRLALDALAFSGRIHVTAFVESETGDKRHTAMSSPVYFHAAAAATPGAAPPALTFYDETALKETFHRGDYRGTDRELQRDPEYAGILRITDLGSGNATGPTDPADAPDDLATPPPTTGGAPTSAAAGALNTYKTCMLFRTQTVDSGVPVGNGPNKGGVEDYHADWDAGKDVIAYGARVWMSQGNWSQPFDADPITGCFTWKTERTGPFNVKVFAYSKNSRGAFVRVHNDVNDFSTNPGTAYANYYKNFKPGNGGTNWIAAGGYGSEFTTAAIVSFGLRRFANVGPKNAAFQVAIDNTPDIPAMGDTPFQQGAFSSAHWGSSNAFLTSGRHYLRVRNIGGDPQSRQKFVVGHEFGHAFAALYYGMRDGAKNVGEVNVSGTHVPGPESACSAGTGSGYSMFTQEWSSMGFREGFAHFLAAVVWNNQHRHGSFDWMGAHLDLELYGNGSGNELGGRLENVCNATSAGVGTNEDWLLFFWDYFTAGVPGCTQQPTLNEMLALYADTRQQSGLQKDNYFEKMRAAAKSRASLPTCMKEGWFDQHAENNGIDN